MTSDGMRFTQAAVAAAILFVCPEALQAQDAATKAMAEQLFQQGRTLMDEGRFAEAAEKLQASLELDLASGTQGSLAKCYEAQGKLASAWAMYTEAATRADREGNEARAEGARKLANGLRPRLPRLQIRLAAPAAPGVRVARNGVVLSAAIFGTDVYVDPGEHIITATAAGYVPFSKTVMVGEREHHAVEIPALEPAQSSDALTDEADADNANSDTANTDTVTDDAAEANLPDDDVTDAVPSPAAPGRTRRWAGLATAGTGVLVVGAGLIVGATAYSAWNDPFDRGDCDRDTLMCTAQGQVDTDSARDRARLADIIVGVGGVAVVAGAILYFTAPKASSERPRMTGLRPSLSPDGVGMLLSGRF